MSGERSKEYLLGTNLNELERLRFQHSVWKGVTDALFNRLDLSPGWRCLDVGSGPGFVAADIRERVGETGEVTCLEPSTYYLDWFREEARNRGWGNVHFINSAVEESELPPEAFDLIFVRWVISFARDHERFLAKLLPALRRGGVLAIQDYYYEGLSLYPHGGAFDRMADVARAYYRLAGGDLYVTARIPPTLRRHGLEIVEFRPTQLAGGPESPVMEWGHQYFTAHIPIMAEKGLITLSERDGLLADWWNHRRDPDAIYFSPIVVDLAARKADR